MADEQIDVAELCLKLEVQAGWWDIMAAKTEEALPQIAEPQRDLLQERLDLYRQHAVELRSAVTALQRTHVAG